MNSVEGVLVAGGGVVGLTAALSLAQRGVLVTVFEAEPELVKEYRASTFHPPTLEMLDDLGVAEELISKGLVADRVQLNGGIHDAVNLGGKLAKVCTVKRVKRCWRPMRRSEGRSPLNTCWRTRTKTIATSHKRTGKLGNASRMR